MHTSEEAVQELVRVNVSGRDFTGPLCATATSMKCFDMSSSIRVKFFSCRIFLFVWHEFTFTSRDGAHAGNCSMWKMDVPCVLEEVFV